MGGLFASRQNLVLILCRRSPGNHKPNRILAFSAGKWQQSLLHKAASEVYRPEELVKN
ncbi:MAG: hypothetical protein RMX68_018820 [Aulosira sp. ZfuVER01]|nr:hypothetical protein [Aulosira sp. DedVER01a]